MVYILHRLNGLTLYCSLKGLQWGILDKKAMDELCRLMREGMHKKSVGKAENSNFLNFLPSPLIFLCITFLHCLSGSVHNGDVKDPPLQLYMKQLRMLAKRDVAQKQAVPSKVLFSLRLAGHSSINIVSI